MAAGQLQCSNLDIALSLKHAKSTTSLSQSKEEEDVLILHDDSFPQCPIYALEVGGDYEIDISLTQKHGLQPPVEAVIGVDVLQSDRSSLPLRTEKVVCTFPQYKARAYFNVSNLAAKQFHTPSPHFASPEEKFPVLELCFKCIIDEELSLTVQPRRTIRCCMFPKGSKCRLQKLMLNAKKVWLSAPQALREIARFTGGCVNTATGLAGMSTL